MPKLLESVNQVIFAVFFLCYAYQLFFVFLRLVRPMPTNFAQKQHRYAVLIPARNESTVIAGLLDSLKAQNYPKELLDIYVIADNCTDQTGQIAKSHGAQVITRHNLREIGKGYALQYAFQTIQKNKSLQYYDGYFVFDADNQLDENFIEEMNRVFDQGHVAVTSYRNSKNYDTNWLSAGYSLWFLRESYFINGARMLFGSSCAISGTGFLVSSALIDELGGWPYHLLTEDIQFSVEQVLRGKRIGYAEKAMLYDEQPIDFATSWRQRLRWAKGFYQVLNRYGGRLLHNIFKRKGFSSYDLLMTIAPAFVLTLFLWFFNTAFLALALIEENPVFVRIALNSLGSGLLGAYFSLFFHGAVASIFQWKKIRASTWKKIFYMFTFPVFLFTYIPISWAALFKKVTWEPIKHIITERVA